MGHLFLSVIVPCYNESENLRRGVLEEIHEYLSEQSYSYEVLISDDGSTDDSRELVLQHCADKPGFRLLCNQHGGKPMAVWQGIRAAGGEIVLFADMDQSTPIDQLGLLLPLFDRGYDIAIGSRGMERRNFPGIGASARGFSALSGDCSCCETSRILSVASRPCGGRSPSDCSRG